MDDETIVILVMLALIILTSALFAIVIKAVVDYFLSLVMSVVIGGIAYGFSWLILSSTSVHEPNIGNYSLYLAILVGMMSFLFFVGLKKVREDDTKDTLIEKKSQENGNRPQKNNQYSPTYERKNIGKGNKISIILIGQEAVGKTTLLSLMYKEFSRNNKFQQFVASDDSGIALEKAYQKLCTIIDQPNFTKPPRLLPGTAGIVQYNFTIENNNFAVYDTAGGLLMRADGDDFEDFKSFISNASVIINVIDGAAMIEGSDFLSDRVNSPTRVRDILSRHKGNNPCLIIFVITKCETWLKSPKELERLKDAFENRHRAILNWVEQNPNCVGIFVPVKTLGCVEFSKKMGKGEDETLVFYKKTNLKFSQEHVDKPILYAVQYCMNRSLLPVEKHFHLYGGASSTA